MERAVPDRHFCVAFAATKGRASADLADVTRNFRHLRTHWRTGVNSNSRATLSAVSRPALAW